MKLRLDLACRALDLICRVVLVLLYGTLVFALVWLPWRGVGEAIFHDFDADLDLPVPLHALMQYEGIKSHLEAPFTDYSARDVMVIPFKVVALSHMASGLMNLHVLRPEMRGELAPLAAEIVRRALTPRVSIYGFDPREVAELGDQGLYLSHLNLILGVHRSISGDVRYDSFHLRVARHLATACLADSDFHIRSFGGPNKWPADQTVTLCSLALYDHIHGTSLSIEPIRGWLATMKSQGIDSATRLPVSELHARVNVPRGCALSWSALYMAQFAPAEAADLYRRYRARYAKTILGLGGFREYPEGQDLGWNVDAGPVIFDIGLAASGIGIGPARVFGDRPAFVTLMRTASAVGLALHDDGARSYRLAPLLGEAILFNGVTATPWFVSLPASGFRERPDAPLGPCLLAAIYLLLIAFATSRILRLLRIAPRRAKPLS